MSRGINKVILVGFTGKDPEVRYTTDGTAVANMSIATSEPWKDKNTGEKKEKTEWHRVVAFRKLAEIISQYVKKGQQVYIEGRLQTRKWQDQSGADRYSTEIVANDMQMLGRNNSNGQSNNNSRPDQDQSWGQGGGNTRGAPPAAPTPEDFDDDIPF